MVTFLHRVQAFFVFTAAQPDLPLPRRPGRFAPDMEI